MKLIPLYGLLLGLFFMLTSSQIVVAQTFKTGDVVYYKTSQFKGGSYFTSPVYVIATVKKVIGSKALLSTDVYLYKCDRDDKYWKMTENLSIAKQSGFGHLYYNWKASENNGYTESTKNLKKYTDQAEKEITKGYISSSSKSCSIIAN